MEVNGQLHTPASIALGKELGYPLNKRLQGPQSQWRRNKSIPSAHNLVTKRLSYPESHRDSSSQFNLIFTDFDSWKFEQMSLLPPLIMDRVNAMYIFIVTSVVHQNFGKFDSGKESI
jgi:hypothetical protein